MIACGDSFKMMKFSITRGAIVGLLSVGIMLAAAGCARHATTPSAISSASAKPGVIATTTQIEDVARVIGGDQINVVGLMPRDADPHTFEPTPEDVSQVASAKLILENGVHLEGWVGELVKNAGGKQPIVVVSKGVNISTISRDFGSNNTPDPHIWMSPLNMLVVTDNIVAGLSKVDTADAAKFRARGEDYKKQLRALDQWAAARLAKVPPAHRKLVTAHDAMGYFAKRYNFQIVGAVIPSPDTEAETSASQLAQLIEKIKEAKVPAIFAEASNNPKWIKQIAQETGVKVVLNLHVDSLGPIGTPAGTYLGFIRDDVEKIAGALQ